MTHIQIGHLLRAGTAGFVAGCSVSQLEAPAFGALVRAPLDDGSQVYGLIHDIHIADDGLVRQLVTAGEVRADVIADSRLNRIVPVEMGVLSVGYGQDGKISHLLPPRPPLSLDAIFLCQPGEVGDFVTANQNRLGYLRHVLRADDLPHGELLAAHLRQAREAAGEEWFARATQELITLLRDDYPALMEVLGALGEIQNGD